MSKRRAYWWRWCIWCIAALVGLGLLAVHGGELYIRTAYPLAYEQEIADASAIYGVSPSLIAAVIRTESRFQADVVSHAGAVGLMQLTPETFTWAQVRAGVKDTQGEEALTDPEINIRYGTVTLLLLYDMFEDETAALAAYNAGQGTVKKWLADKRYSADGVHLDSIPYAETAQYVKRVKSGQTIYRKFYHLI